MAEDIAISVNDVSKMYKLYDNPMDRLKESLGLSRKKKYKEHYALNHVSFQVHKGETVGIIGTNGSGKSTILKIITGVLSPTAGEIAVNGRISALLELGAGFNGEYSGLENVYLNGSMIGFSREEIDAKLQSILDFADIGDFIYQPVKTYSSGMFVRLAFAVAINIDPEILIVDEFTGRIMPGRRYSDGLHQAIEAKEHVKVKRESKTLATITFQNFFNKYDKKGGMTGTALTEEKEFRDIYGMDVVEIPTNRVVQRKDLDDAVYMTKKEKFNAVVEAVKEAHAKHQPVLVGTITIETSELLSRMLKREGIPHNVLNAKFHELEAEIVAQAGQADAVTIATNMAGRGTDIKLDDVAREAGGLKIIGTERHESRRIDNQLRGRSGRQGDPGESRFYISLEDDLMRLFGSERLMKVFTSLGVEENEQIEHKMLSNAIEKAQEKIEFNNFGIRKNLLDYDQVNNEQREIIYEERRQVLDGENMRDAIYKMITDIVDSMTDMCFSDDMDSSEWDLNEFNTAITPIIPIHPLTAEKVKGHKKDEIKHIVKEEAVKLYEAKEAEFPEPEQLRELERVVLLKCIDSKWMDHIDDMEMLRQGIGLMAYGQRDPVVEYKMNAFEMFNSMISSIQEDTVRMLYHVHVEQKIEREQVAKVTGTNKDDSAGPKKPVQRKEDKVYPNDPCPCGSGKKYKQCCGRKAAKI